MVAEIEKQGDYMDVDDENNNGGNSSDYADRAAIEVNNTEGSSDEEDEYVVEKIVDHKITKGGKLQYFLKWKGYPDSDNTWEKEEDVYAKDLIEDYWKKHGGRRSSTERKKSAAAASSRSTTKATSRSSRGPPTIMRKVQPMKKQRVRRVADNDEEIRQESSDEEYPPPEWTNWEDHVAEVETVERDNNDGSLLIYVNWKDGHRTVHPASEVNARCPQKVIRFYETHLRFRNVE